MVDPAPKFKEKVSLPKDDIVECPNGHRNWRGEWTLLGMNYIYIRCPECDESLLRDAQLDDNET